MPVPPYSTLANQATPTGKPHSADKREMGQHGCEKRGGSPFKWDTDQRVRGLTGCCFKNGNFRDFPGGQW